MAAVRRSGFGLQCLSEEERIDLEAMMTLYWHRRVGKGSCDQIVGIQSML